jgi:hypothetical protein
MLEIIRNKLDKKFNFSKTTKLIIFTIILILFSGLSCYLFINYLFEFFIVQAYLYALMKTDNPVKAAWYTLFMFFFYLILKFALIYTGISI